jgi:catechol 2,3-dioxygenase-like lactoylglutathione lyase family enzyme
MSPRATNIAFTVSDLDKSVDFYTEVLKAPPFERRIWDTAETGDYLARRLGYTFVKMDCAFWHISSDEVVLELMQYLEPKSERVHTSLHTIGNAHLSVVTDDLHADFERLSHLGSFRSPPIEIPWGPWKGAWAVVLDDPDGIAIELLQHPPGQRPFD